MINSASRKLIYLHIGSPKTGTSALQYFLLKNREVLDGKGISYPEHLVDGNCISSGNAEQLAHFLRQGEPQQAQHFIEQALQESCGRIIWSSEYFYRMDPTGTEALKHLLSMHEVKVIVYLRRQDAVLVSAYNQGVKRHQRTTCMSSWLAKRLGNEADAYTELSKWSTSFGKENLIIRIYEPSQFFGETIFSDFLHVLDLPLTEEYEIPTRPINPSYRIDALEAMRLLNCLPLARQIHSLDTLLQQYSEAAGKEGDWPYDLIAPAERRRIIDYYADCNRRIAREFLGREDGQLYDAPLPDDTEPWQPYPGLSAADIQRIASFIVGCNSKTSRRIAQAIKQGLHSKETDVRAAAQVLAAGLSQFTSHRATLGDCVRFYGRQLCGRLRGVYDKMPVKLKKPIAAAARKLGFIQ